MGNKLVAGIYPSARLSVFDPGSGKWTVQDKAVDSALPKGTREQDRPYAMTAIDNNRVAVAQCLIKTKLAGHWLSLIHKLEHLKITPLS